MIRRVTKSGKSTLYNDKERCFACGPFFMGSFVLLLCHHLMVLSPGTAVVESDSLNSWYSNDHPADEVESEDEGRQSFEVSSVLNGAFTSRVFSE